MPAPSIIEQLRIADVWSGHPVNFALVTHGERQLAAFYDAQRQLTVALRALGDSSWQFAALPSTLGWDSHNHIAMAVDDTGHVHVAGNMHDVPLIYFRTTAPLDITSFERVFAMVGNNEQSCTYPEFFRGPTGALVFAYRDGSSGRGNHIFNRYDTENRSWRRLLDTPLTDGQGQRNAYPVGPVAGPDGTFHLVWVWRDTPDASTNHDLSYARSRDLVNWESAAGTPLSLPVTLATSDIADRVPSGGGMINNNTKIGFDARGQPVIGYHKYDGNGATQLYNARFEAGAWVAHQTSAWSYRWAFGGNGTLVFEIEVEGVQAANDGTLTQHWYHAREGGWGAFRLDEQTLAAQATIEPPLAYPRELGLPRAAAAGRVVRWQSDSSPRAVDSGTQYALRWETLESNRDLPRTVIPAATPLELFAFVRSHA